jgi:hypothetical protein
MLREKSLAQALRASEVPSGNVRNLQQLLWKSQPWHDKELRHGPALPRRRILRTAFFCVVRVNSLGESRRALSGQRAYTHRGWCFLRRPPAFRRNGTPGPLRQRFALRHRRNVSPRHGVTPASLKRAGGITLKRKNSAAKVLLSSLVAVLFLFTSLGAYAEPHQIAQGTRVRLSLLTDISSASARDGDPFTAVVCEPVFIGNTLLIPQGTKLNGTIGTVQNAKWFSVFRGQSYMNLTFRTMEVDSRIIPIQMSILAIEDRHANGDTKTRKDIKIDEGQVLQEKHDFKGDVIGGALGTGGGALVGAIFSNVVRGFGFGLAGSAVYIAVRKGKEVDLPSQTGMLARIDSTVTMPVLVGSNKDAPQPAPTAVPTVTAATDSGN